MKSGQGFLPFYGCLFNLSIISFAVQKAPLISCNLIGQSLELFLMLLESVSDERSLPMPVSAYIFF